MEMSLSSVKDHLIMDENLKNIFFNDADDKESYKKVGEIFTNIMLAEAYEKISERGPDVFYKGEIAENIIKATRNRGGIMTMQDLMKYRVEVVEPFEFEYREQKIISAPPPASGHVIALALQILDNFQLSTFETLKAWNYIIEAMRFAFAMRSQTGDPKFSMQTVDIVESIHEKKYMEKFVKEHFTEDNNGRLHPFTDVNNYSKPFYANYDGTHTTHVSVLGPDGEAVSCTSTVNLYFGSCVMTDNGIVMNNVMDDFSSPKFENAFGYQPSPENFIVAGKRPMSSTSASIVLDRDGEASFVTGAAGGSRIISSTILSLINALDWKMSLTDNQNAVRIHDQLHDGQTLYEVLDVVKPLDPTIKDGLTDLGYNMTAWERGMSAVTSVSRLSGNIEAAGDPRKGGTGIVID